MVEITKDKFRKTFPKLSKEINSDLQSIRLDSIRSQPKEAEKRARAKIAFTNYDPDIIDFLRRCDTPRQAQEIIKYMEGRGEISISYTRKLRKQLRDKGLRSFGTKKEEGHYFTAT